MARRRLGPYEIVEQLGEGGMGVVFKAKDTRLDRFVAIKVLRADTLVDEERRRRFVQEARSASALNHPNIVTIHDIASDQGTDYIVMEYVQGRTLDRLIGGRMRLRDLLNYATQAADALARAHAAGIVHRDLKPSNLMVTDDQRVKILDFGLAKLMPVTLGPAEATMLADPLKTLDGRVVGTPAYMSPEQAEGKAVDARSDIFSFGAVLYEMATGRPAFRGESTASTLAAVLTTTPMPPAQVVPTLPRDLDRTILRCLRKEPERRFQTMADLAVQLEDIRFESSDHVEAPVPVRTRRAWSWVLGGAALVSVLAAGAWHLWGGTPVNPQPVITPLTTYQGDEAMPSLSPDGTQVAFAWTGPRRDNTDIYVKPVDTVTPLRLTSDPLDDEFPAWSPSGRQLAFLRGQSRTGWALYVSPPIPGSERKVTNLRAVDVGRGTLPIPTWSPDGRWLLVPEQADAPGDNGLFLIDVESGARRAIVTAPTSTVRFGEGLISPRGDDLAYVGCVVAVGAVGCDVWIQPLGPDFSPQGTPRRRTAFHGSIYGAAWMPDERSLLASVSTSQDAFTYLWRVPIAGEEPTRLDWLGSRNWFPSLSRTGNRLAFTEEDANYDILQVDPQRPDTPVTVHPISSSFDERDPEFSPDGSHIAFASARSGRDLEIWIARADGTSEMPLTRGAAGRNRGSPRWSHDGQQIVFDSSSDDGVRRAYIVDAAGGAPRLASDFHANFPVWSPDDKWIYFASDHAATTEPAGPGGGRASSRLEIWRVPSDGGTPEQVTTNGGTGPRISADGRTLYYRRGMTLYVKPLTGGAEHVVVDGIFGTSAAYLPVGDEIFFVAMLDQAQSVSELRAIDLRTLKVRSMHRFEGSNIAGLAVSPDGSTVLISVLRGGSDLRLVEHFR